MITSFFDMSSGGSEKLDWTLITVNLPVGLAVVWFERQFGHDPYNVTCDCCGPDYSITEWNTMEDAIQCYRGYRTKHFHV